MKRFVLVVLVLICASSMIFAQTLNDIKVLAEQGDAEAQYKLALYYIKGNGVAVNYYYATEMLKKAAKQANKDAFTKAYLAELDNYTTFSNYPY